MSDKWDGLLMGDLPEPVAPRTAREPRAIPWVRLLGVVAAMMVVGLGIWRVLGSLAQEAEPSVEQAPTQPTLTVHPEAPAAVSSPAPAAQATSRETNLFEPAHRIAAQYAHAFYERAEGEDWAAITQRLARAATTAWAVELTNSPERQRSDVSAHTRVTGVDVTAEETDPTDPTQWAGALALIFESEDAATQQTVRAWAEVVPGVGWRISRWEEEPSE